MRRVPLDKPWWREDDWLGLELRADRYQRLARADKLDKAKHPRRWLRGVPRLFDELVLAPMGVIATSRDMITTHFRDAQNSPERKEEWELRRQAFFARWEPPRDVLRERYERRKSREVAPEYNSLSFGSSEKLGENDVATPSQPTGRVPGVASGCGNPLKGFLHTQPSIPPGGPTAASQGFSLAVRPLRLPLDPDVSITPTSGYFTIQELRAQTSAAAVAFWSMVQEDGDCWLWTGPRTASGWGVDGGGRLAQRTAFLVASGGPARMRALAAEEAGEPWGLVRARVCSRERLCIHPLHWYFSTSEGNDWWAQTRMDSGKERVISTGTPAEVAYNLTRDATLERFLAAFERSAATIVSDIEKRFAHQNEALGKLALSLQELSAAQNEMITRAVSAMQTFHSKNLAANRAYERPNKSAPGDRFFLARGDQTPLHPTTRDDDASGDPSDGAYDPQGEGLEEIVEDLPLVAPPAGLVVFEASPVVRSAPVSTDLEELGAVGECARVWVVAREGATCDVAALQQVADSWASMLRGTLYDRDAFVYGLCLVLEAAAMDAGCDGSLEWVRDNVGRYANDVYKRLLRAASPGLVVTNAQDS